MFGTEAGGRGGAKVQMAVLFELVDELGIQFLVERGAVGFFRPPARRSVAVLSR